jgi:hypothetical protein
VVTKVAQGIGGKGYSEVTKVAQRIGGKGYSEVTKVAQGIGGKGYSRNWWQGLLKELVARIAQK